jgi:hypothetical protein
MGRARPGAEKARAALARARLRLEGEGAGERPGENKHHKGQESLAFTIGSNRECRGGRLVIRRARLALVSRSSRGSGRALPGIKERTLSNLKLPKRPKSVGDLV